jgi:hypothetical protein
LRLGFVAVFHGLHLLINVSEQIVFAAWRRLAFWLISQRSAGRRTGECRILVSIGNLHQEGER